MLAGGISPAVCSLDQPQEPLNLRQVQWPLFLGHPRNGLFVSLFQHSLVGPLIQTYLSPRPCSNPLFPVAAALVALHATGHQVLCRCVSCLHS